ncbi:hypothetical protein BGZ61DRAFT_533351 [Ilyonectria robusta]|uniref:uncharacterized protein n=1 Tax=Ilyonectria robusta TaxID=1079257 RepID=UPI001E8DBAEF|nr:uncharacterized protein BGZ61DRAFT_533351 [Ilyonectria robusta]KAH8686649.1 hypothetical protein BGZ61DRAFT_533351 [Ilyonectria robusta]
MTTAAQHQQSQQSHSQLGFVVADTYDPDEVVPRDSPLMTPLRPRLAPSPSPPPDIPPAQVSPAFLDDRDKSNRHKVRPNSGDAILVAYLDNGRDPEIARVAARQVLPCDEDSPDDESSLDGPTDEVVMTVPSLQHLAADALQAFATGPAPLPSPASIIALKATPDISVSTRQLSIRDDFPAVTVPAVPYPFSGSNNKPVAKSPPIAVLTTASGELPPIQMDSPRSDSNGQMLPSIRSTLGDFNRLPPESMAPVEKELVSRHGPGPGFPGSPSGGIPRFTPIANPHASPPISPNEVYSRNLPSPRSLSASSPYYYNTNGIHQRSNAEYSSSATGETPSTDHSASTPATSTSVADRMSIDGITNPQVGAYVCTFTGCTAPAFQTQYLLNSHANVHSSARPHYCSVQGCPRSEGGKGFKRKNEMIRHGLVHDSPGYVCPFCPDREHKYPRPDNLQRHVRVHHVDKDKDDPALRDVLSQRPDGPNRGRRRRGPPS